MAFVGPVGVETRAFERVARERFGAYHYDLEVIRLSELLREFSAQGYLSTKLSEAPPYERISTHMDAGDELRQLQTSLLAQAAAAKVASLRDKSDEPGRRFPIPQRAWLFSSLKHPDEVHTLRAVYREGFYLIGLFRTEAERKAALHKRGISSEDADKLIERDRRGETEFGQQTRRTFELADAWVRDESDLRRIVDLIFGHPFRMPSEDENGMALAYTAALRSSDLSRQVGAAIVAPTGELLATGHNEVPAPGGGQYGATGAFWNQGMAAACSARDFEIGEDSNHVERLQIQSSLEEEFARCVAGYGEIDQPRREHLLKALSKILRASPIHDITEYGRAVHAEMSSILAATRTGVSTRGATLFCTTFPCHTCAKHIVAAGISRVVFVEPYPKSKAAHLHGDAISLVGEDIDARIAFLTNPIAARRTKFEPFLGVGPRRYFDLFSMRLGSGTELVRKNPDGKAVEFDETTAQPRVQMPAAGYLFREGEAAAIVQQTLETISKKVRVS